MAKISVCIPVYNSEIWFSQAVESIISQTFKDWEIVVVDDGSTDNIKILLDHYKLELGEQFKYRAFSRSRGIAQSRNDACSLASGEIICVQDADDVSHKDRLKLTWDFMKRKKKIDLVYGGFQIIDALDRPTQEIPGRPFNFEDLKKHNYIGHGSVAYRKSSFDKVKYREECDVIDDWFLYYDFVKAGMNIGWMEDILYFHRELNTGVSLSPEKREKIIAMKEKFYQEANNVDLSAVAD
jgi:glycosyltransferase involved in cell wall biosynthesis